MPPAVSQGAVAVQTREADQPVLRWLAALEHPPTRVATTAERALLRTLEGGCQVPVGALARAEATTLELTATVCAIDGSRHVTGALTGPSEEAEALGIELAERLLADGADAILAEIRSGPGASA